MLTVVAADISRLFSDDVWVLLAGPVGGVGTYAMIYRYYRNADKSHNFERDTFIESEPPRGDEERVGQISRTQNGSIEGGNDGNFRARVERVR